MCLLTVGCGEEIQRKVEQEKAKDDPTVPLLIACEACKEKVAKKSKQCPQCGHPTADSVFIFKKRVEEIRERKEELARLAKLKAEEEKKREEELARLEKARAEEEMRRKEELARLAILEAEEQRRRDEQARQMFYQKLKNRENYVILSDLEMIWVPEGTFTMGSPENEKGHQPDEKQKEVTIKSGFYLGKYEVTQAQYSSVTGIAPYFQKDNRPVENVTWQNSIEFCSKLTQSESNKGRLPDGMKYTLPTEAEWEYACRAGTSSSYFWGDNLSYLDPQANYVEAGLGQTSDVGKYEANPWGFYDMHGNVWEWTSDLYFINYGTARVRRGGSWDSAYSNIRSAKRHYRSPENPSNLIGFRIALKQAD